MPGLDHKFENNHIQKKAMMIKTVSIFLMASLVFQSVKAQSYPKHYFRHPLNIPMQLVANFGELRTNHWHMGLDIRTQQKVNLKVFAAAEGYVSRVVVEPGGFGQAIYINHPNGYTTLYAHMNAFFPALQDYVKKQQYATESWKVDLQLAPDQFPVDKGQYIGLSGSTGGSQGPHVHFEIRDTKTDKVLNPLLFKFPIPDAVPPSVTRLAMYDRNKSTYMQAPQLLNIQKTKNSIIRVGSNKISFAIGAVDRFTGTPNPNGVYLAKLSVDGNPVSSFTLDQIDYNETRYMNGHIDYPYAAKGGAQLQHISPLPGATEIAYDTYGGDGVVHLQDGEVHDVLIEVQDANFNTTRIEFKVQYDGALTPASYTGSEQFLPNNLNVFERENFQLVTTEKTMYDAVNVVYNVVENQAANSVSQQHSFLSAAIPSHDFITVRILPSQPIAEEWKERVVIRNTSGTKTFVQKATWQKGWLMAKFRQFGNYQAFIDNEPPTVYLATTNLSKASRIVFTPKDNFNSIKSFRAELDGQWLRFTNDKGKTWIYSFDEKFPRGEHQLKIFVEDEAGNVTTKVWNVRR